MTKQKSKSHTKQNSENMIRQSTKTNIKLDINLYSNHLTQKLKHQKRERISFPQKSKVIRGKRIAMKRRPQNHKKNNIKRTIRGNKQISCSQRTRGSQLTNLEVKNDNIFINRFAQNNFNFESALNICHSFSPVENHHLQFMKLNSENNRIKYNIFNDKNFRSNFNIPLSLENNIIKEISDISALNTISCNHFNRIERGLFVNLPEVKIEDISNLSCENCLICLNNFLKDEIITTLPCSHIFIVLV